MKRNPALTLISAIIIVILLLIGYFTNGTYSEEVKAWNFKGVVEQVAPSLTSNDLTITVNGKNYSLVGLKMNPNVGIYKGDTIIKKKGDMVLKLIKPNSKDTIFCNKP